MEHVSDIIAKFPGEWVAVRVTKKSNRYGQDDEGVLVFHSPDESQVWDTIRGRLKSDLIAIAYSPAEDEPVYPILM